MSQNIAILTISLFLVASVQMTGLSRVFGDISMSIELPGERYV
jgi:hypothetical protein